jgi:hypothetical protein
MNRSTKAVIAVRASVPFADARRTSVIRYHMSIPVCEDAML